MSTPAGTMGSPVVTIPPWQLLRWCVRRELWENRSLYIAPLIVAAVVLIGFSVSVLRGAESILNAAALGASGQGLRLMLPYSFAAAAIMATIAIVGWFYCLDALHGERRDRSILFWKSLPVSDRITLLSKAAIPLAVLPLIAYAIIVATQCIMFLLSSAVLLAKGGSPADLWAQLTVLKMLVGAGYGLAALALWHAPIYGWLLLVSAWVQRAPILWALLPPAALCVIERLAFDGSYFYDLLRRRIFSGVSEAFSVNAQATTGTIKLGVTPGQMKPIVDVVPDPMKFLANPELWIGLVIAAALIAGCIQLRRLREPL